MEKWHVRASPRYVHQNLPQDVLLLMAPRGVGNIEVLRHRFPVLPPLSLHRCRSPRLVRWHVPNQQLPNCGAVDLWHTVPADLTQLVQSYYLLS